ncbi:hypothetical protein ESA94_20525 [Lacibacter luteus]|uniref:SdpI family protein n=1 Tax=Lacibacter luteus TaxID=2508719 RepID=A0A4Q1CDZ0_9BACT|nr:hypothetical protein [Lacibacter luteus]RXK57587.1 hypothetical protein ESA94_20525 [Lacibacter luteus]
MIILSLLFFAIAAACSAVMDRVENEPAFYKSVFRYNDAKYWLKTESWKHAKRFFGWKADAWHIAKSVMVIFCALTALTYVPVVGWFADLCIYGLVWNITFNLMYNRLFKQ